MGALCIGTLLLKVYSFEGRMRSNRKRYLIHAGLQYTSLQTNSVLVQGHSCSEHCDILALQGVG